MTSSNLSDRYSPQEVEGRIYKWWEESSYFKAEDKSTKPPFCIILPPPNVTGHLHIGHALDHTIQDCLIRWKRMSGFNALWLPGTDHAGIATQSVVEREIKKEGLTRTEMGREKFVERVWSYKHQFGNRIYEQMRKLGDSCDWERAVFTLDDGVSKAVRKVFVGLHKKGLIYRGQRLVNWSGPLETAISDLEVEHKQIKGTLWHIRYPLKDSGKAGAKEGETFLVAATTRPETLLGDAALCVHPEDERYRHLIGKTVLLPLLNREIPIIADVYVDKDFGSGVVKITPAHDFNDYKVGKTHSLPMINILTKRAELNENAGPYAGLKVQEARKRVLEDLKAQGLLEKEEPHVHNVGHCSRSGAVVEPLLSEQWFVKMGDLATPAKRVVESGTIRLEPESWTKVYLHWMNIIEDWCISRQLWWGHRIPAWHCQDCGHIDVSETDLTNCSACSSINISQDEDVLDTWFSSALWPFSTLGWPQDTESQKTFYPTSVMVTGHDILFFWVARMIIMGLEFKKDVPFREVYLHGLVRDSQGRKMSKSLGNSVDPVDMIEKYGADALRFTFLAHIHSGRDFKFSEQRIEGYRNFMNKLWNATRFSLGALADFKPPAGAIPSKSHISAFDQWIIAKLGKAEVLVEEALEQHRFSDAAQTLYEFVWYEFCDWYIEFIKPVIGGTEGSAEERLATQHTLAIVLNRIMRLLHPFTPFITEELYQKIPLKTEACITASYPTREKDRDLIALATPAAALEVEVVKEVVNAIRNIRGENRISPAQRIKVRLTYSDDLAQKILSANRGSISNMGRIDELVLANEGSLAKCALTVIQVDQLKMDVIVPLEGLVDIDEEVKRIRKNLEKMGQEMNGLQGRLSNENFVKNASEEIVEADRKQLEVLKGQLTTLNEALIRLQA